MQRWFSVTAAMAMAVGAASSTAGSASAASFDCKKAKSKVDKLICATPELSKADDELGAAFNEALKALAGPKPATKGATKGASGRPKQLRTAQSHWLKRYRNACPDAACMLAVYQKRSAELRATAKPSGKSGSYSLDNNSVDVLEVTPGHLRFEMLVFFGDDAGGNNGQLCGEVDVANGKGVYVDKEFDCEMRWSFAKDGKLTLAQQGECTFGAGVSASGTYEAPALVSAPTFEFCYRYESVNLPK